MKAIPIKFKIILSFLVPYFLGLILTPKEWWQTGFLSTLGGALSYPVIAMGSGAMLGLLSLISDRTKESFWNITFISTLSITLLIFFSSLITR